LTNRLRVHGLSQGTTEEDYRARLAFELDVITRMQYPGYFLIVADFIKWAKAQGIPVRTGARLGRGFAGRLCADHPDLDPIRFGLLFERFLNPERVSMPDFDIDFCQDRRGEVIDYVQQQLRAGTTWRRSSPLEPCRHAACCATSGACCRCLTDRSTS